MIANPVARHSGTIRDDAGLVHLRRGASEFVDHRRGRAVLVGDRMNHQNRVEVGIGGVLVDDLGQSRAPKPVASSGFGTVTPGRLAVAQSE